jgi:hypothetical protein
MQESRKSQPGAQVASLGQKGQLESAQFSASNSFVGISRTANFQSAANGQGCAGNSRLRNYMRDGHHPLVPNTSVTNSQM